MVVARLRGLGPKKWTRVVLLALVAVTATMGAVELKRSNAATGVAQLPETAAEISVRLAEAAEAEGSHLGFDTNIYPGDETMRLWKEEGTYKWVGYYLPAPCHKDPSWSGKRETLLRMGWGLAVVYVGQQTWGRTPGKAEVVVKYVPRRVKETYRKNGKTRTRTVTKRVAVRTVEPPRAQPGQTCSAHFVSGPRGAVEAQDAITRTRAEGFPPGTVVFLDVERMDVVPQAMRDYYRTWVRELLRDGRFRPGIYTHTHNAEQIYADVKAEFDAAGRRDEPPFWIAGRTSDFAPHKAPMDVGHTFAAVWQGVLDKVEERAGIKLPIDVNVSTLPDPSAAE